MSIQTKPSKKLQTMAFSGNEPDAFNNLQDDLVCHILSFLPTKMAHRTCVLSKRWALICTKILDFHFILPNISDPTLSQEIQSVYTVFLRRENHIRKLRLESDNGCKPSDVYQWILKALDLNVKELDLNLYLVQPAFLPLKLSTFESLVVLKLHGNIQLKFSYCSRVYFPSLKILHLGFLEWNYNEFNLLPILSGCPHLEEFHLRDVLVNPASIKISFPLLKRLQLVLSMPILRVNVPGDKTLDINVPSSLEVLNILDTTPIKYERISFFNVDEAILYINKYPDFDSLYKLLKGISKVKSLYLGEGTIIFLSMEDNLEKLSRLPTFTNLLCLVVDISVNCNWNMLVSFLQNAPKLKSLVIENEYERRKDAGWVVPSDIPTCLSTSLITFEFRAIGDMKSELEFTRYIINESSKLEKAKISAIRALETVRESLLKGSKKSPALLLDIHLLT